MHEDVTESTGLFAVPGFTGAACKTGVKPSGELDLALIRADAPMSAAGMFTTNATAAAPVTLSRAALAAEPHARTLVINSGNANALTGPDGHTHAQAMLDRAALRCGGPALVLSTGVIGVPLPIDAVLSGIDHASTALHREAGPEVSRAILTTDSRIKQCALVATDAQPYTIGGIAKGSGMIHPSMATMLAVIATDAVVAPRRLRALLLRAVERSFHEISVDGDTSTNDAVILLAGASSCEDAPLPIGLEAGLVAVARSLARQIIEDGEGATRVMEIHITRARTHDDARRLARAIACSSLVKTALAGADPNWGRILSAAGNADVPLEPSAMTLRLGHQLVFDRGRPVVCDDAALRAHFAGARVRVELDVASGDHRARMLTTDLSRRYVEINSEYTT